MLLLMAAVWAPAAGKGELSASIDIGTVPLGPRMRSIYDREDLATAAGEQGLETSARRVKAHESSDLIVLQSPKVLIDEPLNAQKESTRRGLTAPESTMKKAAQPDNATSSGTAARVQPNTSSNNITDAVEAAAAMTKYLETVKIMDRVIKDDTTKQGVKGIAKLLEVRFGGGKTLQALTNHTNPTNPNPDPNPSVLDQHHTDDTMAHDATTLTRVDIPPPQPTGNYFAALNASQDNTPRGRAAATQTPPAVASRAHNAMFGVAMVSGPAGVSVLPDSTAHRHHRVRTRGARRTTARTTEIINSQHVSSDGSFDTKTPDSESNTPGLQVRPAEITPLAPTRGTRADIGMKTTDESPPESPHKTQGGQLHDGGTTALERHHHREAEADSLPLDFKTRYEKLLYHPTEGDVEDSAKGSHVRWGEWALIALLGSANVLLLLLLCVCCSQMRHHSVVPGHSSPSSGIIKKQRPRNRTGRRHARLFLGADELSDSSEGSMVYNSGKYSAIKG